MLTEAGVDIATIMFRVGHEDIGYAYYHENLHTNNEKNEKRRFRQSANFVRKRPYKYKLGINVILM